MSYKWEVAIFGTAVRPHTEIYIFDLFWQVVDLFARSAEVESPEVEMTPEIVTTYMVPLRLQLPFAFRLHLPTR